MKGRYILLFILLFLFDIGPIGAQRKIDSFSSNFEGLMDNQISSILQDKFGFMWFATKKGLCRYDGYAYKYFVNNPSDSTTISFNWVTDIAQDDEGNLWLATFGGGLNYYNRKSDKFLHFTKDNHNTSSICGNTLQKLFIDSDKNLWIGTDEGLNLYLKKENRFERITTSNSQLPNKCVSSIAEDDKGNLWLGTMGGGLCLMNKRTKNMVVYKNQISNPRSISDNNIRCITKDARGVMWLGTLQNGLNKAVQAGETISFTRYSHEPEKQNSLANNSILTIYEDSKKNLWIGTENGGVDLFEREQNRFIHHTNIPDNSSSLASNSIWSVFEDSGGSLWFGTFNKGVSKWDSNRDKFLYYNLEPMSSNTSLNFTVTSFVELSPGIILIGTNGDGYFIWDMARKTFEKRSQTPSNKNGLNSNGILSAATDGKGKVWLGTWANGINIARSNISNTSFDKVFSFEDIFAITRDHDNAMWVGTWGSGLHIVQDNWRKVYNYIPNEADPLSISSGNIFCALEDSYQRMWVGTLFGLNLVSGDFDTRFNFKKFYHQSNDTNTISSNTVLTIFEDGQRNLWFGTSFGLNKFNPKNDSFIRINSSLLCDKQIKAIIEDTNGKLWISADNQIFSYNPRENKTVAYDRSDGINTTNFSVGASLKTSNNYCLFGATNGFVKFHPDSVKNNSYIPPLFLVDLKIFNKSVSLNDEEGTLKQPIMFTQEIELSYKQSIFTIEYVALNYSHPEKNQYAYKLEGLEKEWNVVGNQRFASYSNLDPGDYTFMVKASNNDNVWNETPVKLHIIVKPPLWKTFWFKLLLTALLLWLVYSFYVARLKRMRQQLENQEKEFESKRFETEKELIKLQKEKLDTELDYTNKELASSTMNIMQKNEKLISLRDQLFELMPSTDNSVQRKLRQITKEIDDDLENEMKWDRFESNFDLIHDNFIKRFTEKFPRVTHKDLKMCAFIRMNLSNKEIANLLNITLRSVESSRYRIRKKMDLDSEINLNDFIMRY